MIILFGTQAEVLPPLAQSVPESDSDSGMSSPVEEMVTETVDNGEKLQGDRTTKDKSQPQNFMR